MKKICAIALMLMLILSGCDLSSAFSHSLAKGKSLSEEDSVVSLDIYPDFCDTLGAFERVGYQSLDEKSKSTYILLDNAVYSMQNGFIDLPDCSPEEAVAVYHALRQDRPEYFWMSTSYSIRQSGETCALQFAEKSGDWLYSAEERSLYEGEIKRLLTDFSNGTSGYSDYKKELSAHDLLAELITYDKAASTDSTANPSAWDIVGAMCLKSAVCEGYSRAMQVMCFAGGINCTTVTGTAGNAHMWNLVELNGHWYHLDLTADDGDNGIYHFFFNVTDRYIKKSRTVDPLSQGSETGLFNIFLPQCTATEYNYHILNSFYIADRSQTESTVISLICDAVRSGRRSVEFAVSPDMGFVFGETDAAKEFRLERCISAANAELSQSQRIKSYSYGGVEGALGFVISW